MLKKNERTKSLIILATYSTLRIRNSEPNSFVFRSRPWNQPCFFLLFFSPSGFSTVWRVLASIEKASVFQIATPYCPIPKNGPPARLPRENRPTVTSQDFADSHRHLPLVLILSKAFGLILIVCIVRTR